MKTYYVNLNYKLEDDPDSEVGGTSHSEYTLEEFLGESGLLDKKVELLTEPELTKLNQHLKNAGIKTIIPTLIYCINTENNNMILRQLKNSLNKLIDRIYETAKETPEDTFVTSFKVDDDNIQITIDDIWASAYTYQLCEYTHERLSYYTKEEIKDEILQINNLLYDNLKILIKDAYNYINNNIDDIIDYIKIYKNSWDTSYLSLDVINNQIKAYIDTVTETTYQYQIFDTYDLNEIEELENRVVSDEELKELILETTKEKLSEWKFILENFEENK